MKDDIIVLEDDEMMTVAGGMTSAAAIIGTLAGALVADTLGAPATVGAVVGFMVEYAISNAPDSVVQGFAWDAQGYSGMQLNY